MTAIIKIFYERSWTGAMAVYNDITMKNWRVVEKIMLISIKKDEIGLTNKTIINI